MWLLLGVGGSVEGALEVNVASVKLLVGVGAAYPVLVLEPKDVGVESESVFVVCGMLDVELGLGNGGVEVDEEDGDGGRKEIDELDAEDEDEEGEGVKTGGQGGKVRDENTIDEERRVLERVDQVDEGGLVLKLEYGFDEERRLDEGVGILRLKLKLVPDGNSKVIEDGMSGTEDEYEE